MKFYVTYYIPENLDYLHNDRPMPRFDPQRYPLLYQLGFSLFHLQIQVDTVRYNVHVNIRNQFVVSTRFVSGRVKKEMGVQLQNIRENLNKGGPFCHP